MAERERKGSPPYGGAFVAHSRIMDSSDIERAVRRMAHELLERNHGIANLAVFPSVREWREWLQA